MKQKTYAEKEAFRYRMVAGAFGALLLLPFAALAAASVGIDPSSAAGIISTACATLGAVVLGFFGTSIKKDDHVG